MAALPGGDRDTTQQSNPYLDPGRVRAALRTLGLHPTRGMGQHFLVNGHVLDQIIAAAELSRDDLVVEVGPGLGVLSWELIPRVRQVIAIELDKRLSARLRQEFAASAMHVIQDDVLHVPPDTILQHASGIPVSPQSASSQQHTLPPYKVVANLPYAITSPVLRHFLEGEPPPQVMVLLVQWEVARRITAQPGDLSLLAHAVQMYAQPEIVTRVSASSFVPAPAVDTAILRLRIHPRPAVDVVDRDDFFRLLKAAFTQRRKKLSNALPTGLASMGKSYHREHIVAALETAGVSPDRRAETVSLDEWAAVYTALHPDTTGA